MLKHSSNPVIQSWVKVMVADRALDLWDLSSNSSSTTKLNEWPHVPLPPAPCLPGCWNKGKVEHAAGSPTMLCPLYLLQLDEEGSKWAKAAVDIKVTERLEAALCWGVPRDLCLETLCPFELVSPFLLNPDTNRKVATLSCRAAASHLLPCTGYRTGQLASLFQRRIGLGCPLLTA